MKKLRALVTTVALGIGVTGAHANPGPVLPMPFASSDTLREITLAAIAQCTVNRDGVGTPLSAHLRGTGGGSTLAGSRMNPVGTFAPNGQQQIAPQSRFMNATECNFHGPNRGQGIQLALDGIGVFHDDTEGSPCRVLRYAGCMTVQDRNNATVVGYGLGTAGIDDGTGAAVPDDDPATPGVQYCFRHWADALRIIYNGLHAHLNDSGLAAACRSAPPTATLATQRRCNSDVRHTLVSAWGNMFDSRGDDGAGGCDEPACPAGLTHAWRRDDASGTTDVFLALIGAPGVGTIGTAPARTFCNGISNEDLDPIRRDCTSASSSADDPYTACTSVPMRNRNLPFDAATGSPTGAAIGPTGPQVTPPPGPGNTAISDLGLVLAMSMPPTQIFDKSPGAPPGTILIDPVTGQPYNPQYDETLCTAAPIGSGNMRLAEMPFSALTATQRCPSGSPRSGNKCLWPAQAASLTNGKANWFNCRTKRTNRLTGPAAPWANYDARAYNRVQRHPQTGELLLPDTTAGTGGIKDPRFTGGGDSRVHMMFPKTQIVDGGVFTHPRCRQGDATQQIGCLVQADICSIGFAGLEGEDGDVDDSEIAQLGTNAPFFLRAPLDTNTSELDSGDVEVEPRVVSIQYLTEPADGACETGTSNFDVRYPLARVLWLNAAKSFGGAFPGPMTNITNLVDSDPDFPDPTGPNGPLTPDGVPDLRSRENDLLQCMTDRDFMDPIMEAFGYITLPIGQPPAARLRTCP